ncbi:MAG: ABC transporter substrate-binding protein [Saccharofermentanales bacterium]|jgi:peptide/nickel transport system substrate-binding protein
MRRKIALIVAAALIFMLVACGNKDDDKAADKSYRDTINIAMDVDAQTYNPVLSNNTTAYRVAELIFNGLVRMDEKLNIVPGLAESWETSEDGCTLTFKLREGVKFSDGSDFTSAAVKYTYESILNEKYNAPYRSRFLAIEGVETPDDHTAVFKLTTPNTALLAYLTMGIIPEGAMDVKGFDTAPVGTGPYTVENYTLNSLTVLKARDDYWEGKPATETINVYIINDNSVRLASLESGDVDFVCSPLTASDLKLVEGKEGLVMNKVPGLGITYIGVNSGDPILKDLEVRKAIAHMVDKETISNTIYSDMDTPATSPILSSSWAYDKDLKDYEYDPEKAKSILDEAGWKDSDGDGIRDKDGVKLAFTVATHTDDTSRFQVVEYLQNQLKSIGIDTSVSVTEWANFSADMTAKKNQIWVAGWLNLYDPDRMYDMFYSESGSNYGNFNDPEVDKALLDARLSTDQSERAEKYRYVARAATDNVWYITMLEQAYVSIHSDKLEGYTVYPSGSIYTMWTAKMGE